MYKANENPPESFTINEAYEFENQQHHVESDEKSCCECLRKIISFRLWQILILLFVLAAIFVLVILLSPAVLRGKRAAASNDASAEAQSTASPTEHKSSEGASKTTEPALTTSPRSTKPNIRSTEATTTSKIPSTEGPEEKCGVAIVGGGAGGLLLAYMLLVKKKETSVCIFEKENHLGGKIYDHVFSQAPDRPVGLGQLLVFGGNLEERRAFEEFLNDFGNLPWERSLTRVEARGLFADNFDKLQPIAFSALNRSDTVKQMAQDVTKANSSLYFTAGAFLSYYLTPEGKELLEDAYGLNLKDRLYEVNPESYKKYLKNKLADENERASDTRPAEGLSKLIERLKEKVNTLNGKIFFQEKVKSVNVKEGGNFTLKTTNRTVEARKTVLAVGPTALKDMTGVVMENITNHKILRSIVSVPAFFGAAVYEKAWWNDIIAVKKMSEKNMFISSGYCLGITMPYETSSNGKGVLQTIASAGSCSKEWGSTLKISKDVVDREMKKALEYKFERKIPDALSTVYKYWENGFWYLQKAGTKFPLEEIRDWAKRPLAGRDVFLIGKAFYNFGGWLEDTIRSTNETLVEGWNTELVLPP